MSDSTTTYKYYLLTVTNTQLHIAARTFVYKNEVNNYTFHIQSVANDFFTTMTNEPSSNVLRIHTLHYVPRCSIHDFFFEHKNIHLSSLLLGIIQFLKPLYPTIEIVESSDQLNFHTGSNRNGAQHNTLSLYTLALWRKTWYERYMYAKPKYPQGEDYAALLDEKPSLISIVSYFAGTYDDFNYTDFLDTYIDEYNKCKNFGEFVLRFSKEGRFDKLRPWLPTYLHRRAHLPTQFLTVITDVMALKCLYNDAIQESDIPLIDSVVETIYNDTVGDGSDKEVIVKNELVCTMWFTMADLED